MRLKDKVAIVTGGSQGIGEAISRRYAREGARVAIVNRRAALAASVVESIKADGGEAQAFPADITKVQEIYRVVAEVTRVWGGVDILVNNAGTYIVTPAETTTEQDWQTMMDTNLKAVFFCCQAVIPEFRKRNKGKIINLGSIFGNDGFPMSSAYCATKGAIVLLTKTLCLELRDQNINVNSLAPGYIRTQMNVALQNDEGFNTMSFGRFGGKNVWMQPDELTGAAVFLASADSDSVNGTTLFVDRGWAAY
jgi:NAD(P)-dependent dehydrogenase (short-subunit alcohol dehydrogenase family)